jgi:hypothetical protein
MMRICSGFMRRIRAEKELRHVLIEDDDGIERVMHLESVKFELNKMQNKSLIKSSFLLHKYPSKSFPISLSEIVSFSPLL